MKLQSENAAASQMRAFMQAMLPRHPGHVNRILKTPSPPPPGDGPEGPLGSNKEACRSQPHPRTQKPTDPPEDPGTPHLKRSP
jgi:hypothetical protein